VPTLNVKVFVQGPYSNSAAAQQSAASLQGVEREAAGGLYAVSAPLTAQVQVVVDGVANCLSGTSGHGPLS
jgi:hypothetical protein